MAVTAQSRPRRPRSRPARLIRSPPAPGYVRAHWPRYGCTPAPGVCLARLRSASPSFAPHPSNRLRLLPLGRARARPGSVVPGIRLIRAGLCAGCVFRLTRAAPRLLVRRGAAGGRPKSAAVFARRPAPQSSMRSPSRLAAARFAPCPRAAVKSPRPWAEAYPLSSPSSPSQSTKAAMIRSVRSSISASVKSPRREISTSSRTAVPGTSVPLSFV